MTAYTDFHYSPTGSGVISGAQVLEQTEQGINGLGQYVQDNVSGAIDTANEALTTARNADSNATTAINLANSFNAQIIAANQTAGNALTTAQSAQNTANSASSLATTANNSAATALNAANSASAGVTTLTGTVNSLGNRMTAAENAINTNAGNITTLQNNLATTNANVTAASNAANAAQATATSAQSTATLARNQAYVLRYTGTTITGGGTIAYADIDNTDNIKAGDKIIDATGAIYEIASVDIANETVTVSASEIINLAVLPDLFNSANTWSESQTYSKTTISGAAEVLHCKNANVALGETPASDYQKLFMFKDKNNDNFGYYRHLYQTTGSSQFDILVRNKFTNGAPDTSGSIDYLSFSLRLNADKSKEGVLMGSFKPSNTNTYDLGSSSYQWNNLYAKNYFYNGTPWGLDKANTWTGNNTFPLSLNQKGFSPRASIPSSNEFGAYIISDSNNASVMSLNYANRATGVRDLSLRVYDYSGIANGVMVTKDANNNYSFCSINPNDTINLGTSTNKWKSLNGINPGALSLPNGNAQDTSWIGDLTIKDGSDYNLKTFTLNGWVTINIPNTAGNLVVVNNGCGQIVTNAANGITGNNCAVFIPVVANVQISILLVLQTGESVKTAIFAPCLGNA